MIKRWCPVEDCPIVILAPSIELAVDGLWWHYSAVHARMRDVLYIALKLELEAQKHESCP